MLHEPLHAAAWLFLFAVTAFAAGFSIWKGVKLSHYMAVGSSMIAAGLIPFVSTLELMTYSYPAPELPQLTGRLLQAEPLALTAVLLHIYLYTVPVYLITKKKH
ncbi:hypothetical protein [Alkalicoccus luteus]|uniref:hypothetical protein n=1 Tax=Alkalicoccus luteus TaxID=1237094 RepID=UPI00143B3750|nr:hypothetical protein [Alkalicoccus luteus]